MIKVGDDIFVIELYDSYGDEYNRECPAKVTHVFGDTIRITYTEGYWNDVTEIVTLKKIKFYILSPLAKLL